MRDLAHMVEMDAGSGNVRTCRRRDFTQSKRLAMRMKRFVSADVGERGRVDLGILKVGRHDREIFGVERHQP